MAGRPILEEGNKKPDNLVLKLLDSLRIGASVILFSSHFCFLVL